MITMRQLAATLLLAAAWPLAASSAPASLPPAAAFFENSGFAEPKLSPNGRYLAARESKLGERARLLVLDLDKLSVQVVGLFNDADIDYFEWVNNERLVFDSRDSRRTSSDDNTPPGIFAVNRDGSGFRQLTKTTFSKGDNPETGSRFVQTMLDWNHFLLGQPGRQDNDEVYITKAQGSNLVLLRLNTVTGRAVSLPGPGNATRWVLDQQGEPRLVTSDTDDKHTIYLREGEVGQPKWRKLVDTTSYGGQAFTPVGFGPDGGLYAAARKGDKTALYRYDTARQELAAEPLVEMDDYDYLPDMQRPDTEGLVVQKDKLLGVRYRADVQGVAWLDAGGKALQDRVDTLLPGMANVIALPRRPESPWVLVSSYSDVQPLVYLALNTGTGNIIKIGSSHDRIRSEQMGRQELVRYKARDGLSIPAWITYPRGAARKNLPLVMLVHGGPFVRGGEWGWNPEAQFLASRGYMVMEPDFRGSTGYGSAHFRAGWKQWGLKMQDDVADGARWAASQGLADVKRICIAGASYGGYATLMGLVNDPELYQCGVNWAGVTDIRLIYTGNWSAESDTSDGWKTHGMPLMVGDLQKDAAQLEATSPLAQAARIKRPLLLAYGGDDRRVPIYHGEKFRAAVQAGNPNVEWVLYPKEGHGWRLPENRIDFWTRVEKFLDKHIGAAASNRGAP